MTANARRIDHECGQSEDGFAEAAGLPVAVYWLTTRWDWPLLVETGLVAS